MHFKLLSGGHADKRARLVLPSGEYAEMPHGGFSAGDVIHTTVDLVKHYPDGKVRFRNVTPNPNSDPVADAEPVPTVEDDYDETDEVDEGTNWPDLTSMTKAQLIDFAHNNDIDVDAGARKGEVLHAIEAHLERLV